VRGLPGLRQLLPVVRALPELPGLPAQALRRPGRRRQTPGEPGGDPRLPRVG
jgi:hypothetical protein